MSRLIDADALKKALQKWGSDHWTEAFTGDDACSEFDYMIDNEDTIETVPDESSIRDAEGMGRSRKGRSMNVLEIDAGENKDAWINVHDAMPEERESIFAKYKGTDKWQKAFWEKQSGTVLVTIICKNGEKIVTTARTIDGDWNCDHLAIRGSKVIAWQPLPEPPEE